MKYFIIALAFIFLSACNLNEQASKKVVEASLNNNTELMKPVLIHTVFFWTKEGTTSEQMNAFEKGLTKLGTCPQIGAYYWGPPAPTEARGVVDNTYDYAINVHFESVEKQNEYQKEPIHLEFIENHKDLWEKVIVYDNQVK